MPLDSPAAPPVVHHGLVRHAVAPREMAVRQAFGRPLVRATIVAEWKDRYGRVHCLEHTVTSIRPAGDFLPIGAAP
ncbi:MAG: hypothetical protein KGN77_01995 [Xanthomonadaceae bacterium]|nr:hypothetical protein [Xanthomonadaceae bacterium]